MAQSWLITHDAGRCAASGMCMGIAPEHFEPSVDHDGPQLRSTVITEGDAGLDAARDAVLCCPMEALALEPVSIEVEATSRHLAQ